jgi:hypothetical protein
MVVVEGAQAFALRASISSFLFHLTCVQSSPVRPFILSQSRVTFHILHSSTCVTYNCSVTLSSSITTALSAQKIQPLQVQLSAQADTLEDMSYVYDASNITGSQL